MATILKVRCPNCKNPQNYIPAGGQVAGKSKRCVYCGKSFKVHSGPEDSQILSIQK
ncbi:MAG TPA: hypothetical protein VEC16_06655 [Alphaproteobacteria bacterium]|nr:hypothetical protein [Alphaproteobacteria bacterium]